MQLYLLLTFYMSSNFQLTLKTLPKLTGAKHFIKKVVHICPNLIKVFFHIHLL